MSLGRCTGTPAITWTCSGDKVTSYQENQVYHLPGVGMDIDGHVSDAGPVTLDIPFWTCLGHAR